MPHQLRHQPQPYKQRQSPVRLRLHQYLHQHRATLRDKVAVPAAWEPPAQYQIPIAISIPPVAVAPCARSLLELASPAFVSHVFLLEVPVMLVCYVATVQSARESGFVEKWQLISVKDELIEMWEPTTNF